mmetsp:Transcript_64388/g.208934  ORF Transcript_64388/g.208934 Transcript_64388/m.208934 type:complete len:242 (+) Transcript_64388:277-1002(+)
MLEEREQRLAVRSLAVRALSAQATTRQVIDERVQRPTRGPPILQDCVLLVNVLHLLLDASCVFPQAGRLVAIAAGVDPVGGGASRDVREDAGRCEQCRQHQQEDGELHAEERGGHAPGAAQAHEADDHDEQRGGQEEPAQLRREDCQHLIRAPEGSGRGRQCSATQRACGASKHDVVALLLVLRSRGGQRARHLQQPFRGRDRTARATSSARHRARRQRRAHGGTRSARTRCARERGAEAV